MEEEIIPSGLENPHLCRASVGGSKRDYGWEDKGWVGPTLERKGERVNDRLIYSKSEEWANQTLMAFGRASRSLSPFNLSL